MTDNQITSVELPTLFKMTSTGATQQWRIFSTLLEDGTAQFTVEHGQKGGKLQTTTTAVKQGKNLGKTNETSAIQQANLEMESKWKKQHDKGYTTSQFVQKPTRKPMLAHDYTKHKDRVTFPALVQPKLDGIRCLALKDDGVVKLYSRAGKPIETVPHINTALAVVMDDNESWDGELYCPGITFQDITSFVKRQQEGSLQVQYHVYDAITDGSFIGRFRRVER